MKIVNNDFTKEFTQLLKKYKKTLTSDKSGIHVNDSEKLHEVAIQKATSAAEGEDVLSFVYCNSGTRAHAERELNILTKTTPDAIVLPFKNEILALCEAFGKSGQSGGSAPYTANIISQTVKKLMMFEPLVPLTGEDDEWTEITDGDEPRFQNNRDSRVFFGKDDRAYFINAIVFNGNIGGNFTSNGSVSYDGKIIRSKQLIKEFPFIPKTFYVDVVDYRWADKEEKIPDVNGAWWTHLIKDKSQLDEVFKYYDFYN